ncbi:hypothetical protein BGZ63DRAFT_77488 [Mariannaea sp. PMI_226]|nr:hypothetical protein BGZ63DRAFT_77488 [Mariannaea sp. PMI_226]
MVMNRKVASLRHQDPSTTNTQQRTILVWYRFELDASKSSFCDLISFLTTKDIISRTRSMGISAKSANPALHRATSLRGAPAFSQSLAKNSSSFAPLSSPSSSDNPYLIVNLMHGAKSQFLNISLNRIMVPDVALYNQFHSQYYSNRELGSGSELLRVWHVELCPQVSNAQWLQFLGYAPLYLHISSKAPGR